MNQTSSLVLALTVLAMAGCASQTSAAAPPGPAVASSVPAPTAPSSVPAPTVRGTPVQGGDPASPQTLMFTCTLGWQYYNVAPGQGGTIGPFHPGPAPSAAPNANKKPADVWNVTVYNDTTQPVTLDWAQTTFYLHGKSVGTQTSQMDAAETLNPGQFDNGQSDYGGFGGLIDPSNAPSQIENQPGASCAVTSWGNATGQ